MKDEKKSKSQLIEEIKDLRRKLADSGVNPGFQKSVEKDENKHYIRLFQEALKPDMGVIKQYIHDLFYIWSPKGVVCGDMILIETFDTEHIVVLINCERDGILGNYISVIVYFLVDGIINRDHCRKPADILAKLNLYLKKQFQMDTSLSAQNSRINISICQIEYKTEILTYAGAGTSIIIEDNNNRQRIIEGKNKLFKTGRADKCAKCIEEKIKIKTGHRIFLFGNGVVKLLEDQQNKGFGIERLKSFIKSSTEEEFEIRKGKISEGLLRLSSNSKNGSDISMVGFGYKKPSIQDRRTNRGERRKNVSDRSIMEVMYQISTNLSEILYIKTESPYCKIYYRSQKSNPKLLRTTSHSIEFHFKSKDLLRVHRSYLINPKSVISAFQKNREHSLLLKGKRKNIVIPIGRSYYKKLSKTHPEFFL